MSTSAELLTLQSNIKKDPDGYKDEFMLQYRHYQALMDIFKLRPSKESKEFGDLVMFMAQVSRAYPKTMSGLPAELTSLLDSHAAVLEGSLRRQLVGALILLRNRGQVEAMGVLPLFFRLFRCQDKALRQQLFRHIVADLKAANRKTRNERLNRSVQNFMYSVVSDENEAAAKRGLAVLTEMWRRHVWRDARTVNVIASAAFHKSPRVLLAVMKFFLGQDRGGGGEGEEDNEGGSDEEGAGGEGKKPSGPSKEDVYAAYHKGTRSSKKKKQAKLKRVLHTVKKAARKSSGEGSGAESFAAIHLLHDPQSFAERLFSRLAGGGERFETRLAVMAVLSRVIGMHKLLVLNFYPYLQKYIAPHQRDVTAVLAALVQGCHELVPPETLAPVLRQLVDQFVHDKARPEVMTVGLKAVRELVLRCPLVMSPELLGDLAQYKKWREKQVAAAARALIGAFRDINPEMLAKKDRGKGADLALKPREYGDQGVATRVDGAELLERAIAEGRVGGSEEGDEEDDYADLLGGNSSEEEEEGEDSDLESLSGDEGEEGSGSGEWEEVSEDDEEVAAALAQAGEKAGGAGKGKGKKGKAGKKAAEEEEVSGSGSGSEGEEEEEEEEEGEGESDDGWESLGSSDMGEDDEDEEEEEGSEDEEDEEEGGSQSSKKRKAALQKQKAEERRQQQQQHNPDSLSSLKRRLAEAQEARKRRRASDGSAAAAGEEEGADGKEEGEGEEASAPPGVPIEADRILTQEDFMRIRKLKQRALVEAALAKHGLASSSAKRPSQAKRARLLEAAEEEAAEALALRERLAAIGEARVAPEDLVGRHKARKDKAARLASVLEGREGREKFGARSGLKKKKTAGLSEREKQRKKVMPMAARVAQIRRRNAAARGRGRGKNFKGHVRS
ncbi:hypothetical protein Agub_g4529 [Astrephomene gubernaculifera]|uniref:Protein SDA1 n=1 Tax=Astrephomene gubernaculifera TaxID=47775 RepID=A0AAD3HJU2_9CHLO|nr:hypothetical protein Agub_g4529 [Astrephomene gubernaculifera]